MTREEGKLNENEQLALKIAEELSEGREFECDSLDIYKGAMKMADWKDQHPREGLWDSEKVIGWLRANIDNYANYDVKTDECFVNDFEEDLCKAMEGKENNEITALDSFRQIMTVMNKHRLIEPSDFEEETFIPDL